MVRFPLAERARTLLDNLRQHFVWLAMHRGPTAALAAYPLNRPSPKAA